MNTTPFFDEKFPLLNQFILRLVDAYQAQELTRWAELDQRAKNFFSPQQSTAMEELLPGWKKMAAYSQGITQTHVMCIFLGAAMLSEFQMLSPEKQQTVKWIILFHDLAKFHIKGKKDTMHAFNSAVLAARQLPNFGFATTSDYPNLIDPWSDFARNAYTKPLWKTTPIPDNKKLPEILEGIDQLFGRNTPATLITKVILLHISIDADPNYPNPAPFTENEIQRFIYPKLFQLLKIMILGDIEGWSLFKPEVRKQQRSDAYKAFEKIEILIQE